MNPENLRCPWATSPLDIAYHDSEWGVPSHDDRHLFEMLILEGAQAGLSWSTILTRRAGYRRAYAEFDVEAVASFGPEDESRLLADAGIIRNRLKISASIGNARTVIRIVEEFGSFDDYLWQFVDGEPIRNEFREMKEVPVSTPVSDALSKDLKARGCKFVGTTIMYAFMQATGMVNDHLIGCPARRES